MRRALRLSIGLGLIFVLLGNAVLAAADDNVDSYWSADLLDPAPVPNATEAIVVRLWSSDDGSGPLQQITVCSRWHLGATTSRRICGITDSNGEVRLSYTIAGTVSGDTVEVTFSALRSYDWRDLGAVSFIVQ